MVVNESGVCALLKKQHKFGYDVLVDQGTIAIYTEEWLVASNRLLLPRKVLGLLVEHMGAMPAPDSALHIVRDCENQGVMTSVAQGDVNEWRRTGHGEQAVKTPLTYNNMQLYQCADGLRVLGVQALALRMVDNFDMLEAFALEGDRLLFSAEGQTIVLKGYHPYKGKDADHWVQLEDIDWSVRDDET